MSFQNHIKQVAPRLSQLKSGQPAILLDNKVIVAGIGGNSIPAGQGSDGGGSMSFYKCASVNTSDSTWSGYKAVFNQQGYYQFQSQSTTGLEYDSQKITPVVNYCYTDGALLMIEPYDPGIIQVDANTMFLLQGSLHDKSGHVADSAIINNGVVVENGKLTFPNNGYATIAAGSLPNTVLCDNHDWTIQAKINVTSLQYYSTIFGKERDPRGDLTLTPDDRVFFNTGGGCAVRRSLETTGAMLGTHIIKLTHTSANAFMVYVDGVAGVVIQGNGTMSGRDYRAYDMGIGKDAGSYGSYYFSPNTIDWLRISDCIR